MVKLNRSQKVRPKNDMYPLYWTKSSKGGFYMTYDFTFKLNAVEMYRTGQWIDTPQGIGQKISEKEQLSGTMSRKSTS